MSRSVKKTKIRGIAAAESDKKDKTRANRKVRRNNKVAVKTGAEPVLKREITDVWDFAKDGKKYCPGMDTRK